MRIQKILLIISALLIGVVVVPSVFSANVGIRSVYGIFSETYNGAKYGMPATDADAIGLYVWNNTFEVKESTTTPYAYEGNKYYNITVKSIAGNDGWRWGVVAFTPTNTSGYKNMSSYYNGYLKFRARSNNATVKNYQIGLNIGGSEVWVKTLASAVGGFTNDGEWHEISIPLNTTTNASLTSANMANTTQLFLLKSADANLVLGDSVDIDNIVWVKSTVGSFTSSLKRVSDHVSVVGTTMTWNGGSTAGNNAGWLVSDQYIELDLDMYVTNKTWTVTIYTENGATDKNGLISQYNKKVPLCWRASDFDIPYEVGSDTRTFTIGEIVVSTATTNLYDAGSVHNPNEAEYWCWFWMVDKAQNYSGEYNLIWNNSGFHSASNTGEFYGMNQTLGIYPKIYLGARFINVLGGHYTATITVEFTGYE